MLTIFCAVTGLHMQSPIIVSSGPPKMVHIARSVVVMLLSPSKGFQTGFLCLRQESTVQKATLCAMEITHRQASRRGGTRRQSGANVRWFAHACSLQNYSPGRRVTFDAQPASCCTARVVHPCRCSEQADTRNQARWVRG